MKSKIIAELRQAHSMTEAEAERALSSVVAAVRTVAGATDGGARIPGFGTFREKFRKGRAARNPRTGETVHTADKWVLTFKEAKSSR
jgi:nucleoid DNA-binding protein